MSKSKVICIEGIDGSGKSTLCRNLYNYYVTEPNVIECYHAVLPSPSMGPTGEIVREALQDKLMIESIGLYHLFLADRSCVTRSIKFIINKHENCIVILDRYNLSTLAYQAHVMPQSQLISDCFNLDLNIKPDIILYIDVDLDVAMHRIHMSNKKREKFETVGTLSIVQTDYDIALGLCESNWKDVQIRRLNGNLNDLYVLKQAVHYIDSLTK